MALEDALLKLAEAINNHAEALKGVRGTTGTAYGPIDKPAEAPVTVEVSAKEPQPEKPAPKKSAAPVETKQKEEATTVASAQTSPSDTPPDVDVVELKAKFLALVNKDRAAAEGVLTELGFPKLNLVPANLHAKAWGLIAEALNG